MKMMDPYKHLELSRRHYTLEGKLSLLSRSIFETVSIRS